MHSTCTTMWAQVVRHLFNPKKYTVITYRRENIYKYIYVNCITTAAVNTYIESVDYTMFAKWSILKSMRTYIYTLNRYCATRNFQVTCSNSKLNVDWIWTLQKKHISSFMEKDKKRSYCYIIKRCMDGGHMQWWLGCVHFKSCNVITW